VIRSAKPNKCKHCKVRMPEDKARHVLHEDCVDPWLAAQNAKKARKLEAEWRAAARVEKMLDRVKRETQKKIPKLTAEAQKEFNTFIRTRDAKQPCISCGKPPGDMTQLHAGRDAGHYRSIGCASHLRFHEDNCHAQCVKCNQWKAGNAVDYRLGLLVRIGQARVDALESNNEVHKWTREELIEVKKLYTAKAKELKARQE